WGFAPLSATRFRVWPSVNLASCWVDRRWRQAGHRSPIFYTGSMRRTLALVILTVVIGPSAAGAQRLPMAVVPDHYDLAFTIDLNRERFSGDETIHVRVGTTTSRVVLNAVDLDLRDVTIATASSTQKATVSTNRADETATLVVPRPIPPGA